MTSMYENIALKTAKAAFLHAFENHPGYNWNRIVFPSPRRHRQGGASWPVRDKAMPAMQSAEQGAQAIRCMPPCAARVRYNGGADALAGILQPFMTSMSWLSYGEGAKAPVVVATLVRHKKLLMQLTELMLSLSFKKCDLAAGVTKARAAASPSWPHALRDHEIRHWDEVMQKRLQAMCRHVSQARVGKRSWLDRLVAVGESEEQGKMAETVPDEEANTMVEREDEAEGGNLREPLERYGYDSEMGLAWRKKGSEKREYSGQWVFDETSADADVARVRFADGEIRSVASLTVGDTRQKASAGARKARAAAKRPAANILWRGIHAATREPLAIRARKDHDLLTVLDQGKKPKLVCMLETDLFGGDHEAACQFLKPIAEKWSTGELATKGDVYALRDKLLKERGGQVRQSRKKPARAPTRVAGPNANSGKADEHAGGDQQQDSDGEEEDVIHDEDAASESSAPCVDALAEVAFWRDAGLPPDI